MSEQLVLASICARVNVDEKMVKLAVLLGSRLWKTNNAESDFDILLVVTSKCPLIKNGKGFVSVHSGVHDCLVMTEQLFQERLAEFSTYEMCALWVKEEYLLRQTFDPKTLFKYDASKLESAVKSTFFFFCGIMWLMGSETRRKLGFIPERYLELCCVIAKVTNVPYGTETIDRDWPMAQKYMDKGNVDRGKKTITHAIRVVMIANQIASTDRHEITDYTCANGIFLELKQCYEKNWEYYNATYRPVLDELLAELKALVEAS